MVARKNSPWIGVGVYSIPQAARLSGVPSQRIRRWVRGYSYAYKEERRESPALWRPQLPPIDDSLVLGFRDLMEIRFVDAFLDAGVSWPLIRRAAAKAADLFNTTHPFSQERFKTDGRSVFIEAVDESGRTAIWDLVRDQMAFQKIIAPFLRGIDFEADEPVRWWPSGGKRKVVVDPTRSFGRPILAAHGIPTEVIYAAYLAEQTTAVIASWFEIPEAAVVAAVDFEESLAA
jgi:uncharacterized protein (DUF433 family)